MVRSSASGPTVEDGVAGGPDGLTEALVVLRRRLHAMVGGTLGTDAGPFETALDDVEAAAAVLRERLHQAEARVRRERATVATVGHELRNPLSVIATGIEVLRSQPPTAAVLTGDRTIRIVRDQVRHMTRLLEDLLRASREAAIELDLSLVPVAISGLVEQAVLAVDERVRSRGQVLAVHLPEHEVRVRADAQRLQQVLVNLLDNASKYTGDGGRLGLVAEEEPHACVLRVWDEGIGIAGDEVARLRSMFTQGRGLPGRERSGMGIGLALVGRIVELHGGTLEIVSRDQGRPLGTEIVVRLSRTLTPRAHGPATAPQRVSPAVARILVVDGNREHAALVVRLLEARGHEVRTAERGPEALELVESGWPHVVIVDVELPTTDGRELARRIRERLPSVRIHGVSGFAPSPERVAGFDGYALKPLGSAAVDELLGPDA